MSLIVATEPTAAVFGPWLADYHWDVEESLSDPFDPNPPTLDFLAYSFPHAAFGWIDYDYTDAVLTEAPQDVKDAVDLVFAEINGFTDIQIVRSASSTAPVRIVMDAADDGAYAYFPAQEVWGGDVFFGAPVVAPDPGNEAYLYVLHEIGHALGLDHGHEYPEFVATGFDSQEFTVVTYSDYVGDTDTFSFDSGPVDWAQSYMQLDIAALQFLYGANYSTTGEIWSGDTVYGFDPASGEMKVNGAGQGAPAGNRIFRTIWDGNGNDTYDLSNYTTDLVVSLWPGAFSTLSDTQLADLDRFSGSLDRVARGNIANALLVDGDTRALIENAVGGIGNDVISGNQVGNDLQGRSGDDELLGLQGSDSLSGQQGRDRLTGGNGNDQLTGGQGRDVLIGGNGRDTLKGGNGADKLMGKDGDDVLRGGNSDDRIIGGLGADRLYGDAGADRFQYLSVGDSTPGAADRIRDFSPGEDVIDLSGLGFTLQDLFVGGTLLTGAASVVTRQRAQDYVVEADLQGDAVIDLKIVVETLGAMTADDFVF